jgi:TonB-linked SusC/RagA family outer membrane protein
MFMRVKLFQLTGMMMVFILSPFLLLAQEMISGKVISQLDQSPISSVSIVIKGSSKGTMTNVDGLFSIRAAKGAVLVFSGVGIKSKEVIVNDNASLIVSVDQDQNVLNEVTVTALGIKKETKRLGYAVQEIKGSDLVKAREPNPINSLVGKVAGLDVNISRELLGAPAVSLRGQNISLYVVDGMPINSDTWNLSPDDIETYTVLKGLAATAIYGSRAQNGAILITTKKGTKNKKGYSIEFNSSTQVDKGFIALPRTQDLYGGGDYSQYSFGDGKGGGINDNDYDVWGPKLNGQLIPQYDSPIDPVTGVRQGTPYVARGKNNLARFIQAGLLTTNNLSFSSTTDRSSIRMSMSQSYQKGIVPNTKLNTGNFNISASYDLSSKLKLEGNLNYNRQATPNIPDVNYGPNSIIYNITIWTGADWDVQDPKIKAIWQPGKVGTQQIFAEYQRYHNPWFMSYEWLRGHYKNDIYGNLGLTYKINSNVEALVRANVSTFNVMRNEKMPYSAHPYGREGERGDYREDVRSLFDNNLEGIVKYKKTLPLGINVDAFAGANVRSFSYNSSFTTTNYLNVPGLYTFANSLNPIVAYSNSARMLVLSSYYSANVDLNKYFSLSVSGRLDKNSAQPANKNAFFYPSFSGASVISDYVKLPEAISFLKVRGSYAIAKSPSTTAYTGPAGYPVGYGAAYVSTYGGPTYALSAPAYSIGTVYNNTTGAYAPSSALDSNTQVSKTSSKEIGLDVKFLKNRLSFSATAYSNILGPSIRNYPVSQTTGISGYTTNAIKTKLNGVELSVSGTPIMKKDFTWNVLLNWSTFTEKYLDLPSNFANYQFQQGDRVDKLYGTLIARTPDGQMIHDASGYAVRLPKAQYLGNADVKFSWSAYNKFTYKSFTFGFQFDGKVGGLIQDYVKRKGVEGGRDISTVQGKVGEAREYEFLNYKTPGYAGIYVGEGVQIANGAAITFDPVTGVITNMDKLTFKTNASKVRWIQDYVSSTFNQPEFVTVAKTYAKLREVVFTYAVPSKLFAKSFISSIDVSLVGRNLLYFFPEAFKDLDVDQYSGRTIYSGNSREYGLQTPTTRSYGFNLNIKF